MNSKFKDYCNIIKVKNIQQVDNNISGVQNKDYVQSREMFCAPCTASTAFAVYLLVSIYYLSSFLR